MNIYFVGQKIIKEAVYFDDIEVISVLAVKVTEEYSPIVEIKEYTSCPQDTCCHIAHMSR